LAALLAVAAVPAFATDPADEGGPPRGTPFILQTHAGRTVTDQDFRGLVLLVFFGFTHCPDVCPVSLQTVAQVVDLLGADAARMQPLFVTLDPERDGSETLRDYVSAFHPRLIGLTGPRAMIERVAAAYRVKHERVEIKGRDSNDYTIDHTASLFLIGPSGEYIRRFSHGLPPEEVAKEVREVILALGRPGGGRRRGG
jgi:protein SCO1/2